MDNLEFPLYVSDDIKQLCKDLSIKLPKTSPITFITEDNLGEQSLLYVDADRLINAVNHFGWPVSHIDDEKQLKKYYKDDKLRNLFCSDSARHVKGEAYNLVKNSGIKIRPGRLIKKLCPDLSDEKTEKFAAGIIKSVEISIVEDITGTYKIDPPHSCMSGGNMEFYERNGLKIVIAKLQKKLVGRALLWPKIKFPALDKTLPLLDRRFDIDGRFVSLIELFGLERGFVIRASNRPEDKIQFNYKGKLFKDDISFPLKFYKCEFMPYHDTLVYASKRKENFILTNFTGRFTLKSTSGRNPLFVETVFSKYLNEEIPKNNAIYLEYNDDWAVSSDTVETADGVYLIRDCLVCSACTHSFYKENVHLSVDETPVCQKCSRKLQAGKCKGRYVKKKDAIQINGKWVYKDDDALVCNVSGPILTTDNGVYYDSLTPSGHWTEDNETGKLF